jgi:hypothetical protein
MKALKEAVKESISELESGEESLHLAPVFDSDRAARALSDFLAEARGILDQIEDGYVRVGGAMETDMARRNVLRYLAGKAGEVEIHELPRAGGLGGRFAGSIVDGLVGDGFLSSRRDATYPNMTYLRITREGREELRRIGVRESMAWLHGAHSPIAEAVGSAQAALERLVKAISG